MWLWDVLAAALFVASSGLLFNKRYRENVYLLTLAGLVALVATYLMTKDIVTRIVDERLAAQTSAHSGGTVSPGSAPSDTSVRASPGGDNSSAERPSGPLRATPDDILGAQAYDRHDYATALRILTPLADNGDPTAQYFVGVMALRGEGMARDTQRAVALLRQAASAGIADAQNYMARFYRRGENVPQGYDEAMKWYLLAAKQGYKNSQYWIALLYRDGKGVAADRQAAYMWAVIASSEGDQTAMQLKSQLEPALSPADAAAARDRAAQWLATSVTKRPVSIYSLTRASP